MLFWEWHIARFRAILHAKAISRSIWDLGMKRLTHNVEESEELQCLEKYQAKMGRLIAYSQFWEWHITRFRVIFHAEAITRSTRILTMKRLTHNVEESEELQCTKNTKQRCNVLFREWHIARFRAILHAKTISRSTWDLIMKRLTHNVGESEEL